VDGLTSTKWVLRSASAHAAKDFSSGKNQYTHRSLPLDAVPPAGTAGGLNFASPALKRKLEPAVPSAAAAATAAAPAAASDSAADESSAKKHKSG
jgi:hypothetical protein